MADSVLTADQGNTDEVAAEQQDATVTAEAPEAKADAPDKAETPADEAADETPEDAAPDEYADFDIPEGVTVNDDDLTAFRALAKDMNLTQEQAQKLVTMQTEAVQRQQDAWQAQQEQWVEGLKSDKEFGGNKFSENVAVASKALEQFGTPELKEALDASGYGNHPELVRVFYRIGKAISEDGGVSGGDAAGTSKSRAEILFG